LAWTVPLLWGALWAAKWNDQPPGATSEPPEARTKTVGETILTNALFGAAPVLVFLLSAGLGAEWRPVRNVLLTVSVACYIARMAIADYRQMRSADLVRRQASALDSAVDGMAIVDREGKYTYVNAGYAKLLGNTAREAMIGQSWQAVSVRAGDGSITSEQEIGARCRRKVSGTES
jgi:PAS domain-containing protein